MKYVISQYFHREEKNQVICTTPEEAKRRIEEGNAIAAPGWRWGLSEVNFLKDDGTDMPIEEANAIRRACGQIEW